jgi:hemolysin D
METQLRASNDPGLFILEVLLRLLYIDVNSEQLRDRVGDRPAGVAEIVRCAKELGLKARALSADWDRLTTAPLPGIVALHGGGFLLLGKINYEKAIVLAPNASQPTVMTREAFEALWDGRLILLAKRGPLGKLCRHLDPSRFIAASIGRLRGSGKAARAKDVAQARAEMASAAVINFFDGRRKRLRRPDANPRQGDKRPGSAEIAFLPAALEIVETPPSPIGRAITFSIIAIFALALAWACIGTVDIVAVAAGKIIPSDRTKTVQPFETGVVRAIRVHDGQSVKAGDVLIELDATMSAADLGHLKSDLLAAQLTVARLRAALAGKDDPLTAFVPPEAPSALIQMHRRFLISQSAEQKAKLATIDGQVAQKRAERATIEASIEKLKATIKPLQERVSIREELFKKQLGPKMTYLSEFQDLVSQQQEVLVQQSRYSETDAAVGALMETRARTVAEYERSLFDELDKSEQKAAGLEQDVVKAEQRTSMQTLTAPVDGIVQQLAIHTIGGVVTPAQALMLVVPAESRLEIEAMISNRDIGFVEVGQSAAIKIDTFNFTRYGLLQGKVITVSQDAITRDKPQDKAGDAARGAETSSSEPKGQELVYAARISVERTQMEIEDKQVKLSPGMAVTIEVKTGARRLISYLFSPLMRYKHDSLRER